MPKNGNLILNGLYRIKVGAIELELASCANIFEIPLIAGIPISLLTDTHLLFFASLVYFHDDKF